MSNITLIIPTYRNPKYLDLCLRSAIENRVDKNNPIMVVVDGFVEESQDVLTKYESDIQLLVNDENKGMQYSQNIGVMQAETEYVFIINDDNVLPTEWDKRVLECVNDAKHIEDTDKFVLTVNQVEPTGPGMFNFPSTTILGNTVDNFNYEEWLKLEKNLQSPVSYDLNGNIYPFVIQKKWYLACGGFDTFYPSPNVCDWDFFLKLELLGFESPRTYKMHLWHFGSVSTKKNSESIKFTDKEANAHILYKWKWGASAYNTPLTNSKIPPDGKFRGFEV